MSLFSTVVDFLKPTPPPSPQVLKALDRVAELVDPLLKSASGFERHLTLPVEHALGYCEGLVGALPGPIDINRQSFASAPLVHALFATAEDIDQMLGRSQAVRDFLAEPQSWENEYFHEHVDALRSERAGLRADASVARAHLTVLRGKTEGDEYAVHTRHLADLDTKLRETAASLMPDQLLQALCVFLQAPEASLCLAPVSITVDRLGVVSDHPADDNNVHTLNFPELRGRDQRQYMVMLARIRRDEAQAAIDIVRDQQRLFMLI